MKIFGIAGYSGSGKTTLIERGLPQLDALLAQLPPCDLVLVEGYKRCAIPKLEVHRAETAKPWLFPDDPNILAVASDVEPPDGFPRIDLDAVFQITDFILNHAYSRPTA